MKKYLNIIEHSQTLLNIYLQGLQTLTGQVATIPTTLSVQTPSTSGDDGGMQIRRRSSTGPGQVPLKKRYHCTKCVHPPFQTKYGLTQHISIKHESNRMECDICGKKMTAYHLLDHRDSHSLSDRYVCEEKVSKMRKACGKSYKQKSGIVRHLKNAHKGCIIPFSLIVISIHVTILPQFLRYNI